MIYIRDMKTKKKYLLKGFTEQEYHNGTRETELFDRIYKLLIKHDIQDGEIINNKGGEDRLMRTYDPKKHYRSNFNFTTCYLPTGKGKVMLSVAVYGLESAVSIKAEGDGLLFNSIDEARAYALNKGYLVEYDPEEELNRALKHQDAINSSRLKKSLKTQNKMNKQD